MTHLTDTELSDLLIDTAASSGSAQAHLAGCSRCAAELHQLRAGLANFKAATSAFAESRQRPVRQPSLSLAASRPASFAMAFAVAVLLVVAGVQTRPADVVSTPDLMMANDIGQHPATVVEGSGASSESDEALLNEVDTQIAASYPSSLQPLASDSYATVSTTTGANSSRTQTLNERN